MFSTITSYVRQRRQRKGFTLIELLLVVAIIGIIAALVLPRFGDVKQQANTAAIKSDLRNLMTAQEVFANATTGASYATNTTALTNWTASPNVVVTISGASGTGYTATAYHSQIGTGTMCYLTVSTGGSAVNRITGC